MNNVAVSSETAEKILHTLRQRADSRMYKNLCDQVFGSELDQPFSLNRRHLISIPSTKRLSNPSSSLKLLQTSYENGLVYTLHEASVRLRTIFMLYSTGRVSSIYFVVVIVAVYQWTKTFRLLASTKELVVFTV